MEVYQDGAATCCPAWNRVGIVKGDNLKVLWNSPEFNKAREALKSSNHYTYCRYECPRARYHNRDLIPGGFTSPYHIRIAFDETCNLRCQTCRPDYIKTDESLIKAKLSDLEQNFGQKIEGLEMSGAGEVTASPILRNWLFGLTREKFPRLNRVVFHTNGILFNENFWNQLPEFIRGCVAAIDVSIDAATRETYEKVRRGGKWETLLENLKFIESLHRRSVFSFVVQRDNYKEIEDFYELISTLFPRKEYWRVLYQTVDNWGRIPQEEYDRQNVFADKEIQEDLQNSLRRVLRHGNVDFYGELPPAKICRLI